MSIARRIGNNPQHFRRSKYLAQNLGGVWTYSPVSRCWLCDDGRWVASEGAHFVLRDAQGETLGIVDEHMRPPIVLPERRAMMLARDEEALRLYQLGLSYAEVGRKLQRLGPNSMMVGGPVGKDRARRIVRRAMSRV